MATSPKDLAAAQTKPTIDAKEDTTPVLSKAATAVDAVVDTAPKPATVIEKDEATVVMEQLIAAYMQVNTGYMTTPEQRKQVADRFNAVVRHAINRPTPGCIGALYKFFKEQRNLVLAPQYAFTGHEHRTTNLAEKVSYLYAVMYEATEERPGKLDMVKIREILGSEFAEFFSKLSK